MNNVIFEKMNNFTECDPQGLITREVRQTCVFLTTECPKSIDVVIHDEFDTKKTHRIKKEDARRLISHLDMIDDYSILPPFVQ